MSGEFTDKDRERLKGVEVKLDKMCEDLGKFIETASSEVGFPRCAARGVQWKETEKHQERVDNFIIWFYRSIVVAPILAVLAAIWTHYEGIGKLFGFIKEMPIP